jgi:hypothetical protein
MAKPNYKQQKKQKEAARKSRHADKLLRRTGKAGEPADAAAAPLTNAMTPGKV